jgi:hypothetical protein
MNARRMERAPTSDDSKPEAYDETGAGARPAPAEDEASRERPVRAWYSMRRKGWRKDPHGQGFLCPYASCKSSGDIHSRAHHDRWHEDILANFQTTDELIDGLRGEIAARDETINIQSDEIDRINNRLDVLTEIMAHVTAQGVQAVIRQALTDMAARDEP